MPVAAWSLQWPAITTAKNGEEVGIRSQTMGSKESKGGAPSNKKDDDANAPILPQVEHKVEATSQDAASEQPAAEAGDDSDDKQPPNDAAPLILKRDPRAELRSLTLASYWPRRFTLSILLFLGNLLCVPLLSVAIVAMSKQYKWSTAYQGHVHASFFYGYLATQLFGGYVSDKYRGKRVLAISFGLMGVVLAVTPPMAPFVPALIINRILLGLVEGVQMPAVQHLMVWPLQVFSGGDVWHDSRLVFVLSDRRIGCRSTSARSPWVCSARACSWARSSPT